MCNPKINLHHVVIKHGLIVLIFSELILCFTIPSHFNYIFIFQQFQFRFTIQNMFSIFLLPLIVHLSLMLILLILQGHF